MADLQSSLASLMQVPGLQQLMNQSLTQQNQMQPLRTAINQQAANMLPNSAFAGQTDQYGRANMASVPQANFTTPPPSDGSGVLKTLALLGAGAGGGSLLTLLFQNLFGKKNGQASGGSSSGAGSGSGAGSSFSFGHNTLGGYLHDLFTRNSGGDQHPDAQGGLQIPGGEFDPNTVYGQPAQKNWNQIPDWLTAPNTVYGQPAQENWNQIPDWLTVQQNNGVPMDPSAGGYGPNADSSGDGF